MQPVQDLTVEDRVSRTQYQYTLEDADANELNAWTGRLVDKLQGLPSLRDVATDQQDSGLANHAGYRSRYRLPPGHRHADRSTTRSTTPSASAWSRPCLPSSNQYHVVLEVAPGFPQQSRRDLAKIYVKSATGTEFRLALSLTMSRPQRPLTINHQGQFPVVTISFNLPPTSRSGSAVKDIKQAEQEIGLPASIQTSFQGTAAAFQNSLANEIYADSRGSRRGLHRSGRAV